MSVRSNRLVYPARDAALEREGLANARTSAAESFRLAWPHRNTNRRARIVAECNLRTLIDVRRLQST